MNLEYRAHYDALLESGLYDDLVSADLLVPHEERPLDWAIASGAYKVLEPRRVDFVSYPYEWCFGQLRDAALLTLEVEKRALERGMSLKDATAYNIQFDGARPILIDTLSFERYREGEPWVAYRQFCQHFLAPLALMARVDVRLVHLLERYLDGIPLDLASRVLPSRTWSRPSLLLHIHLHARSIRRHADSPPRPRQVGRTARQGLASNLEATVRRLSWNPAGTEWVEYERTHGYTAPARGAKESIVAGYLREIKPTDVWDLGCNVGVFSRMAAAQGARVLAIDDDPAALERLYSEMKQAREGRILPLFIDLSNPSPSVGWANLERRSLTDRGPASVVLALAVIHHLAITNNTPLERMAEYFARLGSHLIVEFVPKSDPQVSRLLVSREDVFPNYTREEFESAFEEHYETKTAQPVPDTERWIYWMRKRGELP